MKKLLLCVIMVAFGVTVSSQEAISKLNFGVTGGLYNLEAKFNLGDGAISSDKWGYFVGFILDISISDNFNIQSEINFAQLAEGEDDQKELIIPIMIKYYISDKFSVQSGPVFDFILDSEDDGVNKFGLGIGLGAGYDFSNKLFASARYSFGLTDRLKESEIPEEVFGGGSFKFNIFQLGVGYRF